MSRTQINSFVLQSFSNTFVGIGRNRIINGEMLFDQVNAGALVSVNGDPSPHFYGCDQFYGRGTASAGVFTMQQTTSSPPVGFLNYTHITVTTQDISGTAGNFYIFTQPLEGYNIRDFLFGNPTAASLTLSFWARSNLTGQFSGSIGNSSGTRSYAFIYNMTASNTWQHFTITLPGETTGSWTLNNTASMFLNFDLGTGSTYQGSFTGTWSTSNLLAVSGSNKLITSTSNTLDITGVQLEIGTTATNFEYRPYQLELQMCQRYYEKSYDIDTAIGTATGTNGDEVVGGQTGATTVSSSSIYYKMTKRANPTVTIWDYNGTAGNAAWRNTSGVDTNRATTVINGCTRYFGIRQTVALEFLAQCQWAADARL